MEAQGNCRIAVSVSPELFCLGEGAVFFVSENELLWGKGRKKHGKTFWKLILEMVCTIFC